MKKSVLQPWIGRIESFLVSFSKSHLIEAKITEAINTLSKLKVRADVMLEEEVSRNWNEILSKEYNFNRMEKEIKALAKIRFVFVISRTFKFKYNRDIRFFLIFFYVLVWFYSVM